MKLHARRPEPNLPRTHDEFWATTQPAAAHAPHPDRLDDLGPERPSDHLAGAISAPACRCDRPMPMVDQNGERRCASCGKAT